MALQYDGRESPLNRPVTSTDDVEKLTRDAVETAVAQADETLTDIARQVADLHDRAARLTAHRDHLVAWLANRDA